jgi:hypothetical protein
VSLAFVLSMPLMAGAGFTVRLLGVELPDRGSHLIAIDHVDLVRAPYVWKLRGTGKRAHAEATMPGAYLRATFQGSATVGLVIDGTANRGCPRSSMPVVEYAIDEAAFTAVALTRTEFD